MFCALLSDSQKDAALYAAYRQLFNLFFNQRVLSGLSFSDNIDGVPDGEFDLANEAKADGAPQRAQGRNVKGGAQTV